MAAPGLIGAANSVFLLSLLSYQGSEADADRADTEADTGSVVIVRPSVSSVPSRRIIRTRIQADIIARRIAVAGRRQIVVPRRRGVAGLIPGCVGVETPAAIAIVRGRYAHSGADGAFPIDEATAVVAPFNAGTRVQSALAVLLGNTGRSASNLAGREGRYGG
jgi:hypothetical protein